MRESRRFGPVRAKPDGLDGRCEEASSHDRRTPSSDSGVQTFDTIEDLRQALLAFRRTYNRTCLIERHGFITPAAFRRKQLQPVALAV
jgi:hypothetical protein